MVRLFDKLKDLPILKFVELVETNLEVTSTFAPHSGPLTLRQAQGPQGEGPTIAVHQPGNCKPGHP